MKKQFAKCAAIMSLTLTLSTLAARAAWAQPGGDELSVLSLNIRRGPR